MGKRVAIIQGHPDPVARHFGHALAAAYAKGAQEAGHEVKSIEVGSIDVPFVRSKDEWEHGELSDALGQAQRTIGWADHIVIFYPLWLGSMPARLKAFFEQVFRPGFALRQGPGKTSFGKGLAGKSARVVVTMGMPAFIYRWYFRAHSLKSLERNILKFCGIGPIGESLIGMVETPKEKQRQRWLAAMQALGQDAR